ncbi:CLUMA_CG011208, isoform A [Clunio marinus]|uniref:CLUMA_CG011208, isoform A n=1 Tax=Clunio marinus TaxID=568069 RepID=A0A1J1IC79_9DIPT|nr:CLUMA_CG011208, isoform A [Clunio marinus]
MSEIKAKNDAQTNDEVCEKHSEKLTEVLREYIKELGNKLQLVTEISKNIYDQYCKSKTDLNQIENIFTLQNAAQKKIEAENIKVENQLNQKISLMRNEFLNEWKRLYKYQQMYEIIRQELDGCCDECNVLDMKLKTEKRDCHKVLCEVKHIVKHNKSNKTFREDKFFEMTKKRDKFALKLNQLGSENDCLRHKMFEITKEIDVTRSDLKIQFASVKMFDDWSMENITERRRVLEEMVKICHENSNQDEDYLQLNNKISNMARDIENSKETIKYLKALLNTLTSGNKNQECKCICKIPAKTLYKLMKTNENSINALTTVDDS